MQCAPTGTYSGAFDVLFKTIRDEVYGWAKSSTAYLIFRPQGVRALYKGATPPAVGWAAIDSVLLGSLHNYRLFLVHHGITDISPSTGLPRLTILGHGMAGLFAGLTRYTTKRICSLPSQLTSSPQCNNCHTNRTSQRSVVISAVLVVMPHVQSTQ
jgi:solute carrier family 25 carnitine/acylcarnitine transporter 20/29